MKLQVNTGGAWKDVVEFPRNRKGQVLAAARQLARASGSAMRWCVLGPDGKRDWLTLPAGLVARCRYCGCTDAIACAGGCHWVEVDVCSKCELLAASDEEPTHVAP